MRAISSSYDSQLVFTSFLQLGVFWVFSPDDSPIHGFTDLRIHGYTDSFVNAPRCRVQWRAVACQNIRVLLSRCCSEHCRVGGEEEVEKQ